MRLPKKKITREDLAQISAILGVEDLTRMESLHIEPARTPGRHGPTVTISFHEHGLTDPSVDDDGVIYTMQIPLDLEAGV